MAAHPILEPLDSSARRLDDVIALLGQNEKDLERVSDWMPEETHALARRAEDLRASIVHVRSTLEGALR